MRSANVFRRDKQRRRDVEAHSAKFLSELPKMSACNPLWNILEECQGGVRLADDSRRVIDRPVASVPASFVVVAKPISRTAVGLAWRAGRDEIDESPQRSGVQCFEAGAENRSRLQRLRFHPTHEPGCRTGFPLDETQNARSESE